MAFSGSFGVIHFAGNLAASQTLEGHKEGIWLFGANDQQEEQVMRLSLVGMSGSGKSFWSGKLSRSGFRRMCCDDLIADRLGAQLGSKRGGIAKVGRWMGLPFEPQYREREAAYLACETEVMNEILAGFDTTGGDDLGENTVIDTTGSVIYTGEAILTKLRRCSTVVHLSTPIEIQKVKLVAYMKNPRPVLWRNMFTQRLDETNEQALARCYPLLLSSREKQYETLAHVTISYYKHRRVGYGVAEFLSSTGMRTR
jgi:shikimate kinase